MDGRSSWRPFSTVTTIDTMLKSRNYEIEILLKTMPNGHHDFSKEIQKTQCLFQFSLHFFFFRSTLVTEGPYVAVPFIVRLVWHPMSGLTSRRLIRKLIMMLKKIRIPSFGPQMSGRPEKFCQYVNWQMDCVPRERRRLRERLCCYGRVQ